MPRIWGRPTIRASHWHTWWDKDASHVGGCIGSWGSFTWPKNVANVTSFMQCLVDCSGPRTPTSNFLRRCWADLWVAASGILNENTTAPSDSWMIRNIRVPFRWVTCSSCAIYCDCTDLAVGSVQKGLAKGRARVCWSCGSLSGSWFICCPYRITHFLAQMNQHDVQLKATLIV